MNQIDGEGESIELIVEESMLGQRLDTALATALQHRLTSGEWAGSKLSFSRSKIALWISEQRLRRNDVVVNKLSTRLSLGDRLTLCVPQQEESRLLADASVKFSVVFEDDSLLVIDKPAGLVVHPGAGNPNGTLAHGLLSYAKGNLATQSHEDFRPGIVHRLDKDTSGLLLVAKNDQSYAALVRQFSPPRTISRSYFALTLKEPRDQKFFARAGFSSVRDGIIDMPISRHTKDRTKMTVAVQGRESVTHWQVAQELKHGLLLRLELETGRTHQIRVHLQAAGAGIVGDKTYGPPLVEIPTQLRTLVKVFGRQALHAGEIDFLHPVNKARMHFSREMPEDMRHLISEFDQ